MTLQDSCYCARFTDENKKGDFEKLATSLKGGESVNGRSGIWTHIQRFMSSFHWFFSFYTILPKGEKRGNVTNYWENFNCAVTWCHVIQGPPPPKKKILHLFSAWLVQFLVRQCCFCQLLRHGAEGEVHPSSDGQGESSVTNPPNEYQKLMGFSPYPGGTCRTASFGYKHGFVLERNRCPQQAVSEMEAGPICLLVRVDSQLMYLVVLGSMNKQPSGSDCCGFQNLATKAPGGSLGVFHPHSDFQPLGERRAERQRRQPGVGKEENIWSSQSGWQIVKWPWKDTPKTNEI